jgi:hypothetical protein
MTTREEIVRVQNENAQRAYRVLFGTPEGRIVLGDLIAYCHGRKTEFDENDRKHAFKSGQRDVLMRICEFMNLTIDEIYALRGFGTVRLEPQEEQ